MTPEMAALVAFAVLMLLFWYADRTDRRNNAAAHMRDALTPFDPAKTAGGSAGKGYTGGCGDQLYYVPDPAIDDEYDHHTLDAIYADHALVAQHDAAMKLP